MYVINAEAEKYISPYRGLTKTEKKAKRYAPPIQAEHTHTFSAPSVATCEPSELKCIDCFVTNTGNSTVKEYWWNKYQEGITPMRYDANAATAVASISVPSDEQKKIDYLNERARKIFNKIESSFSAMFHLYGPSQPRYYKELIDAIKNGDYEIDEKSAKRADAAWEERDDEEDSYFDYGVFYGINFTKFPKADYDGRDAAYKELREEFQKVLDIIAIMPAEEALAAVQAFEKWAPSNAPTKQ